MVADDPAPRGAIPNWQLATTFEDYIRNCDEGLEEYSQRRAAELLGWPRITLFRARLMAELPDDLFDRLLAAGILSSKALANIALAYKRDRNFAADIQRCPHCGGVVRVRHAIPTKAREVIKTWLDKTT